MSDERAALEDALHAADLRGDLCEHHGFREEPLIAYCQSDVEQSDVYVLLVGWRYGHIVPGDTVSVTEHEFDAAWAKRDEKKIFVYFRDDSTEPAKADADPAELMRAKAFRGRIRERCSPRGFTEIQGLKERFLADLVQWLMRTRATDRGFLRPWRVTCDRGKQWDIAKAKLLRMPSRRGATICLVWGEDRQGHSFFVERLRSKQVVRQLDPNYVEMQWLGGALGDSEFVDVMHLALADHLLGDQAGACESGAAAIAALRADGSVLFAFTEIDASRWDARVAARVHAYVRSWLAPPLDSLSRPICVTLVMRRSGRAIQDELEAIAAIAPERIVLLPELHDVKGDEFQSWAAAERIHVALGVPDAFAPVRRVFDDRQSWPIEDLYDQVDEIYRKLAR